jgi:hypothetical protein
MIYYISLNHFLNTFYGLEFVKVGIEAYEEDE